MSAPHYIVAAVKSWNVQAFKRHTSDLPGVWHLIDRVEDLNIDNLERIQPRYIFFPHWSRVVPELILNRYECICFHMTNVPYGRGGSPLQNLIVRGHTETMLTALRMEKELDAGPVYLKKKMSLFGKASDIYERQADLCYEMIRYILEERPEPIPQEGEVTVFKRRKPGDSQLPAELTLERLYDFIRMLDADSYPHAYIKHGNMRLEFTDACLDRAGKELSARVKFTSSDIEEGESL